MTLKCLLDLDGVLANFVGGICKSLHVENPYERPENFNEYHMEKALGISAGELFAQCTYDFWVGLEEMPDARELVGLCTCAFGEENICILSSPTINEGCADGKIRWIERHFPQFKRRFLIGPAKEFCASSKSILIDDSNSNCDKFDNVGGASVLVPRPWNSLYKFRESAITYVKRGIDYLVTYTLD